MSLRDYQEQEKQMRGISQQQSQPVFQQQAQAGTNWSQPYSQPLVGEVNGERVLVLQIGDQPGSSDVFKCLGADGFTATVREQHVRITAIPSPAGAYIPLETTLGLRNIQQGTLSNLQTR